MNVDTADLTELVRQVQMLTGRVSALTGRVSASARQAAQTGAELARLADRVTRATEAEAVIRRASYPEAMLTGHGPASPRHARPRHLRVVREGGQR